ncbi:MAG: DNA-processing protein DprA [Prevotella sp.]|nr:DNA-processing protein DprA [Candidatus Prevotella equi]
MLLLASLATGRLSLSDAKTLYDTAGSATVIWENRNDIRQIIPDATDRLVELFREDLSYHERKAEEEQKWAEENHVRMVTIDDPDYPERLRHCHDAPLVLFMRGKADLNAKHIINVVGTRKCTPYGQDVINSIVKDLAATGIDITIASGLAYGIDITAHRAALQHNIPTVGVVAHGQDMIYPYIHRTEANKMVTGNGSVITEYFHGTRPEARNFLQRNRIIAGLSDATIVVESASHGGGLVTARIASDYGREVFAVPGPVNAEFSKGCNNLIRDNKAALITSAQDILNLMSWENSAILQKARAEGIERSLFVDLTTEEQRIVDALKEHGDSQTNMLVAYTTLPINTITTSLFALEMKGVVKAMSGNTYHLIG